MSGEGKFSCVMAGLVPAIHVFTVGPARHGCPAQGRAWQHPNSPRCARETQR